VVDTLGNTDGGVLFIMACGVWLASAALVWLQRERLLSLLPAKAAKAA
jgi:hypothetical protein